MTENQEKELIKTLGTLVNGVTEIQSDVRDIKGTLKEHTSTLAEHTSTLADHSLKLDYLVARVDSIAGTVMNHEERLRALEESGGNIH
ncbi:MAG: hypothetical protein AAB288_13790 [Acidobacteriota bacterium]